MINYEKFKEALFKLIEPVERPINLEDVIRALYEREIKLGLHRSGLGGTAYRGGEETDEEYDKRQAKLNLVNQEKNLLNTIYLWEMGKPADKQVNIVLADITKLLKI